MHQFQRNLRMKIYLRQKLCVQWPALIQDYLPQKKLNLNVWGPWVLIFKSIEV